MKNCKVLLLVLAILCCGVMTCCGNENTVPTKPKVITDPTESTISEEASENSSEAVTEATSKKTDVKYISKEKAKKNALNHARLQEATFTKIELEKNKKEPYYQLEFYFSSAEYEYQVQAITGEILEYEKDGEVELQEKQEETTTSAQEKDNDDQEVVLLTLKQAQDNALKHTGEKKVIFTKAELVENYLIKNYDLDFYSDEYEYDYIIDAYTGEILDYVREKREAEE